MRKLKMPKQELNNFEDVFHIFEASQNAKGVSETTLNNYKYNLKNISKYLEVKKPFDDVTKSDVEQMVVAMRKAGLAHNSIARPSDELDPFGEEFTEMAEKLRKLNEEQQAQALRRMNIHSEICDRFGLFAK